MTHSEQIGTRVGFIVLKVRILILIYTAKNIISYLSILANVLMDMNCQIIVTQESIRNLQEMSKI